MCLFILGDISSIILTLMVFMYAVTSYHLTTVLNNQLMSRSHRHPAIMGGPNMVVLVASYDF